MDLRIIGTGIAVVFAIIALSAVTLYLTFRIKETFREDKGTKVQIAKIGFIIGILFLAGGTFFFFAEAIQPSKNTTTTIYSNNTNYTPVPTMTSETGGIYEMKSPIAISEDPIINHTPTPTPISLPSRWGDYYNPTAAQSHTVEPMITPVPVVTTPTNLSNGTNITPIPTATPHNNESTPTPMPTVSPTATPTPTSNSTNTSTPSPSPTTPTPTPSPIHTSTPEPTPGHTPANTPTPAPTIIVIATPTTTLTSKA